ncbi:MAG TPA: fluoride efflux transporter CrcB [Catalimonadaceae bacterium]|nr:fluoride efflux transporter CrcB [Catalimonadaceae bacterium]HPI09812.1 fluoride efflux transporter CrcB [Catalimonadaceae bacterium]
MNFASIVWVFIGSGLGGVARFVISWFFRQNLPTLFPWGTLTINILACSLAGWVVSKNLQANLLGAPVSVILLVGFCGGFSTFSTFGLETWQLISKGQIFAAAGYVLASVLFGVMAFALTIRTV